MRVGPFSPLWQRGMTLLELMVSVVIGTLLLLSLNSVTKLALDVRTERRASNELTYQGRFALDKLVDRARSLAPKPLTLPSAGTTGDWFAPAGCSGSACTMYCRKSATRQLIETTTADTTCSGSAVLANYVDSFSASLPAAMGPLDRHTGVLTLTLSQGAGTSLSLRTQIRFGGGLM